MAIHFPERKYLNFVELQSRWQADLNDIRAAVASGALKVSMHIKEKVTWIDWVPDDRPWVPKSRLVPEPLWTEEHGESQVEACGWFYLQEPRETGAFACSLRFISSTPRPDKEKGATAFDWRSLDRDISLSDVEEKGVFMLTEIARFESNHGAQRSPIEQESPLQTRERNSLLIMIALLTKAAGLDLDANSKTAGIIESAAAAAGITLSRRAIDNHLKRARETVPTRSKSA